MIKGLQQIYIHAYIHTCTAGGHLAIWHQDRTHAYTYTHTKLTYTYTAGGHLALVKNPYTCIHTCIHAYTHTYTAGGHLALVERNSEITNSTTTHTYIHTHTNIYTCIYIHTYTHTHIHSWRPSGPSRTRPRNQRIQKQPFTKQHRIYHGRTVANNGSKIRSK
jgi:hypothetical protein